MFWLRFLLLGTAAAAGHPVLTEVMDNPRGGEDTIPGGRANEFIELYNPGPDTVDVYGYTLADGDALDSLVAWDPGRFGRLADPDALTGGTRLLPQCFAVILDRDYTDPANDQPYDFPPGTLALTTANTTLGDGLAAGDPVALYAPGGHDLARRVSTCGRPEETDDYHFANSAWLSGLDQPDGVSLERIFYSLPDSSAYWAPCSRPAGHSLGRHYQAPAPEEDSLSDTAGPAPRWWLAADSLSSRSGVALSEFMSDPGPGRAEWVEIHNRGTRVVDLFHWQLGDAAGSAVITTSHIPLAPGEYAVLRGKNDTLSYALASVRVLKITSWRSLLNQGRDMIILRNGAGTVVDSVAYDADSLEGRPGVSRERRDLAGRANDPANWALSKNLSGATPGFANSTAGAAAARLQLAPQSPWFCPQSGGGTSAFRCHVQSPPDCELRLTIFDAAGRPVRSLPYAYNLRSETEWDGRGSGGGLCPAGVYILSAETRRNGTVVERQKCAFILVRY